MKKNNKRSKKIRNLVLVCVLSAILLTVSTYAWFIGMQTVRVNSFDINIATTDGLMLSLDGVTWTTELDTAAATAYEGNTNQWLTEKNGEELISKGLIPVSSVGDINTTSSRLRLFEKGSMTATKGGYRLLTSEVLNHNAEKEADGYVAFDLFIRNMSGEAYYSTNDVENEEAIYLTYDSGVTIGAGGTRDTGIENSVRLAFAQIGRVENQEYSNDSGATYPASTVTGITCQTTGAVTGICRTAQIWEPNDKDHITNAINYYDESCSKREAPTDDIKFKYAPKTADSSTHCSTVANGTAYPTYAISRAIDIADAVDVYDGEAYNEYTTNTVEPADYSEYLTGKNAAADKETYGADYKLVAYDTFTDTEKQSRAAARNVFMTLAPNSITKVRVYVYIEGQDIDNYDFAQLGKAIKVNFGFTKERYTTDDYDDEPVTIIPGAENVRKVSYTATGAVTETQNAIYDSTLHVFHVLDTTTEFTFKDGETDKTATFQNGAWAFN